MDISRKPSSIHVDEFSGAIWEKKTQRHAIICTHIIEANIKKKSRSKLCPSCSSSYACLRILLFCLITFTSLISLVSLINLYILPSLAILVTPFISVPELLSYFGISASNGKMAMKSSRNQPRKYCFAI